MHRKVSVIPLHIPLRGVIHRGYLERQSHEHALTHLTFETLRLGQDARETSHHSFLPAERLSLGMGPCCPRAQISRGISLGAAEFARRQISADTVHPLLAAGTPCEAGPLHF